MAAEGSLLLSCRAGEHEQRAPSPCKGTSDPQALPRQSPPRPLLPCPGSPACPGMPGSRLHGSRHLGVWLAVVFSRGKASDYPESPNGLCLAVSSAQALSPVFLPGANARSRLTCDELAKRACSASRSDKPRLCPLNLSVAGTSAAVGAILVAWARNTGSSRRSRHFDAVLMPEYVNLEMCSL